MPPPFPGEPVIQLRCMQLQSLLRDGPGGSSSNQFASGLTLPKGAARKAHLQGMRGGGRRAVLPRWQKEYKLLL